MRELDRVIIGQDKAKRALSLAVYRHQLGLSMDAGHNTPAFGPQHVLLVGPTGCGKTRLVRELGRLIDTPIATCSATNLVEVGYSGEHVDTVVHRLLHAAQGDVRRAERGIIFIDEIDKKRRVSDISRDVSGEGVQQSLLKLMDGAKVAIRREDETMMVSTRGILFVCAGAFPGIEQILDSHHQHGSLGFACIQGDPDTGTLELDGHGALVEFGMIPELLGRFTTVARLRPLTLNELERVLSDSKASVIHSTQAFAARHGAKLSVSKGAMRAIARRALSLGTGARALDRVATQALEPTIWRLLQEQRTVDRIEVTRRTVDEGQKARFFYGASRRAEEEDRPALPRLVTREFGRVDGITNTRGWTHDQIRERLEEVLPSLEIEAAPKSARTWWQRFVDARDPDPRVVLRVAEELTKRKATIAELFTAFVCSATNSIQGIFHYLDYKRLKDELDSKPKLNPSADGARDGQDLGFTEGPQK
ncbi:MAG: AAA family ATPase [Planctomycetes bacterium]|nr:AAA family ATPase [Planctomycetota bacterium]